MASIETAVRYVQNNKDVGNNIDGVIDLPPQLCMPLDLSALIEWTFPNLLHNCKNPSWIAERAILAPHNSIVQEVNNAVAAKFPGEEWVCSSADVIVDEENAVAIPTEYLNSLEVSGLPPHRLCLKPGMLIMLLCNLAPKDGLWNGTRLLVQRVINEQLLQATIAGSHQTVLIPRIALQPTDESFPFVWQRRQFPVRLAFAMTIQGGPSIVFFLN